MAASSTRYKASKSQASYTNISMHTQSGFGAADTSNVYQTSDAFAVPTRAGHTEVELLGLAPQTSQSHQLSEAHQAAFIDSVGTTHSSKCRYHIPILLMSDNVDEHEKNLDPMARWLAEGPHEQCTLLHLPDGQLSIYKECQCSDILPSGMDMEIEE
jgi:hypothetical protein